MMAALRLVLDAIDMPPLDRAPRGARQQRLLSRLPELDDGVLAVLLTLGPDLLPREWARILEADVSEVERALAWFRDEETSAVPVTRLA